MGRVTVAPLSPSVRAAVAENIPLVHYLVNRHVVRFPHMSEYREDIVQECVLTVCQAATRHRPALGTFGAYVGAVTSNAIKLFATRLPRYVLTEEIPELADLSPGPDRQLDTRRMVQRVTDAVTRSRRSNTHRARKDVADYVAHKYGGTFLRELAEEAGITVQGIHTRVKGIDRVVRQVSASVRAEGGGHGRGESAEVA